VPPKRDTRHRELTPEMAFDLAGWGNPVFETEEERRAAWAEHRDELLARRAGLPGTRPRAYWQYEPGTPGEDVDTDDRWEAQIRFLAERGELRDDEVQELADDVVQKATWTGEAQQRARVRLDAALEGLAAGHDQQHGGAD
jgi:hypothetical protein